MGESYSTNFCEVVTQYILGCDPKHSTSGYFVAVRDGSQVEGRAKLSVYYFRILSRFSFVRLKLCAI